MKQLIVSNEKSTFIVSQKVKPSWKLHTIPVKPWNNALLRSDINIKLTQIRYWHKFQQQTGNLIQILTSEFNPANIINLLQIISNALTFFFIWISKQREQKRQSRSCIRRVDINVGVKRTMGIIAVVEGTVTPHKEQLIIDECHIVAWLSANFTHAVHFMACQLHSSVRNKYIRIVNLVCCALCKLILVIFVRTLFFSLFFFLSSNWNILFIFYV